MTCEQGVDANGPTLTVSAQEFAGRAVAAAQYAKLRPSGRQVARLQILRRPAVLMTSQQSESLDVSDRIRTIRITLRSGAVPPERVRGTLLSCARTVLHNVDGVT